MGEYRKIELTKTYDAWRYDGRTIGSAPDWALERMKDSSAHKPGDIWFDKFEKSDNDMRVQYGNAGNEVYKVNVGDYLVLDEDGNITVVPEEEFKNNYQKIG